MPVHVDQNEEVLFLPAETYSLVERSVPIACVDFVPTRRDGEQLRVGLILRDSPYGRVWCHLGGRIGRGETIREALQRHADDTLGVALDLADDPQPKHVYQWFPPELAPTDGGTLAYGDDTRKHAIGLSFVAQITGNPAAANEAHEFAWFARDELPDALWPGCRTLLDRLLA